MCSGAFFKEQLWNTFRFLIALFLILSLIEAQLQMKSEWRKNFIVEVSFFMMKIIGSLSKDDGNGNDHVTPENDDLIG